MQGTLSITMASLEKAQLTAAWQAYSSDTGQVTKEALDTTDTLQRVIIRIFTDWPGDTTQSRRVNCAMMRNAVHFALVSGAELRQPLQNYLLLFLVRPFHHT